METIPHGITIGGYSPDAAKETLALVTARNAAGQTPAWDYGTARSECVMPLMAKKDGLRLKSISFRVKVYMAGRLRVCLRKYTSPTMLVEKLITDTVRGYNDLTVDMGGFLLEKGTEYQLCITASNNFYAPCVEAGEVVENEYLDVTKASSYQDGDHRILFSGTVTIVDGGFRYIHTYNDLHLIPVCRPVVQPPTEKMLTLDVEGMNGVADLSHGLTGYPVFGDREGSWQFWLDTDKCREAVDWGGPVGAMAYRDIQWKLMNRMGSPFETKIILDDEPQFYYVGRIWVSGKPTQQYNHMKVTLQYRLYPYKYLVKEPDGDWLWDPFCFETDLATRQMKDVFIPAGGEERFPLVDSDKPSAVFVTSTGKAAANLENQNGTGYVPVREVFDYVGINFDQKMAYSRVIYSFATKEHRIRLSHINTGVMVLNRGEKVITMSLQRHGTSLTLASDKSDYTLTDALQGVMPSLLLNVTLEPDTAYDVVMSIAGKVGSYEREEKTLMPNIMVSPGDEHEDGGEYIRLLEGSEDLTDANGTVHHTWFYGEMGFYAGDGAVLTPGVQEELGRVGETITDMGKTVVVKAEEDTTVSVSCRPAFL